MEAMKPRHAISQLQPSLRETQHQWLLELMLLLPQTLKCDWPSSALWLNFWSCFWERKYLKECHLCADLQNMFGVFFFFMHEDYFVGRKMASWLTLNAIFVSVICHFLALGTHWGGCMSFFVSMKRSKNILISIIALLISTHFSGLIAVFCLAIIIFGVPLTKEPHPTSCL